MDKQIIDERKWVQEMINPITSYTEVDKKTYRLFLEVKIIHLVATDFIGGCGKI